MVLRFDDAVNEGDWSTSVVPAKAGTHTPKIFNWNEMLQPSFVSRNLGGYGAPPSRGRR
jgi:hypothetical protein